MLDIETSPVTVHTWTLRPKYIDHNWVIKSGSVLCFSSKWYGEKKITFQSTQKKSLNYLLQSAHDLMGQADAICHYNGSSFDIPVLNTELIKHGFKPPSPAKQLDLLKVVWRNFRFASSKLDFVASQLGLGSKIRHSGPKLWLDCMAGKPDAWRKMERYNKMDVTLLEALYERMKPWIPNHPNVAAFEDVTGCPACASVNLKRKGYAITNIMKYQRYSCRDCGKWFRGNKTVSDRRGEKFVNIQ